MLKQVLQFSQMLADGKHFYAMPFYGITSFPHFKLDHFWHNALLSLVNILTRPWFSRTWTVRGRPTTESDSPTRSP